MRQKMMRQTMQYGYFARIHMPAPGLAQYGFPLRRFA